MSPLLVIEEQTQSFGIQSSLYFSSRQLNGEGSQLVNSYIRTEEDNLTHNTCPGWETKA